MYPCDLCQRQLTQMAAEGAIIRSLFRVTANGKGTKREGGGQEEGEREMDGKELRCAKYMYQPTSYEKYNDYMLHTCTNTNRKYQKK